MTAKYKNHKEAESEGQLNDILRTVRSIDGNVEEILDTMKDQFDAECYDPAWSHKDYFDAYEH